MARYAVTIEYYIAGVVMSPQSLDLMATLEFVETNLFDKEYMLSFLGEKLNAKIFSYGVKEMKCTNIPLLHREIITTNTTVISIDEKMKRLEEQFWELESKLTKGKEKVDDSEEIKILESKLTKGRDKIIEM